MPILDPLHPLQSTILEVLAEKKDLTMVLLYKEITKRHGITVSLQNLYRTVGQMLEKQMLVREGKKLSLNFVWITKLMHFTETLQSSYLQQKDSWDLPTKEGERREFVAESLIGLDPIWTDVLLKLTHATPMHEWYEYNSHIYHALGAPQTEISLYQTLRERGIHHHLLFGNDTFLDRYADKLVPVPFPQCISNDTPFPKEGYILFVCGEYIVECVFPRVITQHMDLFFQAVHSIEQFDAELFSSIFKMRARCKLTIRKSTKDAKKLRAKIAAFFPAGKSRRSER